jgi:hypothetical protein
MPSKDSSGYKSNVWDKSFLLTISGVLIAGILYGLNQLLEEEVGGDDAVSAGSGGSGGGDD